VLRRFGHVLLIVALLAATGMHWAVLQSIAWTNMLAENLQKTSVSEAIERTFNGDHPCDLCIGISKGKQEEKKTEFRCELKKLEFILVRQPIIFSAPLDYRLLPTLIESAPEISHRPPVPPPRSVLA